MLPKFTAFDAASNEVAHDYGRVFEHERFEQFERLKIGASSAAIGLLRQLSECLPAPYFCLYVLVVSREGEEQGRYQSPPLETTAELTDFLQEFAPLLTTDGRHHLWAGATDKSGLLIYDRHNVIYAYGPLEAYKTALEALSYREQAFGFPVPHAHHFHAENDEQVRRLLAHWDWQWFPLAPSDEE
ncbi:hypothetical protein [Hymenobacter sp. CRA2]|uniref:hypothetical protein n=1 Tax=Hymenobacter sp. CRA2 TaxID=1955620 RepID=UPI00098ECA4E|nr:hypothetical protein [Hymenobacter sp. CRA2]OON67426.1 hypothetical protein B0919_18355 [Hymenobacter sp. CRA2]